VYRVYKCICECGTSGYGNDISGRNGDSMWWYGNADSIFRSIILVE